MPEEGRFTFGPRAVNFLPQDPTPQGPRPVPLPTLGSAHLRMAQESQVDSGGCRQQHQQEHGRRQQPVEQEAC